MAVGADDGGIKRLQEIRRRNAKRRNIAILFGGLTALAIGGAVWALQSRLEEAPLADDVPPATAADGGTRVAVTSGGAVPATGVSGGVPIPAVGTGSTPDTILIPHQELTRSQLKANEALVESMYPRRGDPIRLYMVPSGMNVVIHMRPAKLWSNDPVWAELRYSLTEDVTNWMATQLKTYCRRDPQQIEECLICLRLGATGTAPAVSSVVHFAQEEKLSNLIEEFAGEPLNEENRPRINSAGEWAYLIKDMKTIAIVPEQDKYELPEVITVPNPNPTEGIYRLLDLTDRERAFTVLFEIDDVKRHEEWLFSESTRPVFRKVLNWFGDDAETVAWSVDVHGDSSVSEILMRNRSVANSTRMAKDVIQRLEFLPNDLVFATELMRPSTQGFRAIIGRFPAMIEAYRQATIPTLDTRHVRLTTVLPRKAAPNLALGMLLSWDISTQTDFSAASTPDMPIAAAEPPKTNTVEVPDSVEERLKQLRFEGEFNNPFQDAIAYVAEETKTEFNIDGNALKDAGFTKNMPIKLDLGEVNGLEALKAIILSERCRPPVPEKRICIVIDEANKSVLVSTEAFAKANEQTVYPLITE